MKKRTLSQTREFLFNSNREMAYMQNALPWNNKPVKDARDTQIKQLEHEILRKGLTELSALLVLKKKANFL